MPRGSARPKPLSANGCSCPRFADPFAAVPRRRHELRAAIGPGAFEDAGGRVQREPFDERNAGYAMDGALVEKLAAEKLETAAATVRAEGWKWVECSATAPAGHLV